MRSTSHSLLRVTRVVTEGVDYSSGNPGPSCDGSEQEKESVREKSRKKGTIIQKIGKDIRVNGVLESSEEEGE